jgi:hypothetical protein
MNDDTYATSLRIAAPPQELPRHHVGWEHFLDRLVLAGAGKDPGPDPWGQEES